MSDTLNISRSVLGMQDPSCLPRYTPGARKHTHNHRVESWLHQAPYRFGATKDPTTTTDVIVVGTGARAAGRTGLAVRAWLEQAQFHSLLSDSVRSLQARAELTASNAQHKLEALRQARGLLALRDGWGGYDGNRAFSEATIEAAVEVLDALYAYCSSQGVGLTAPIVGPADSGTVDIYWRTENGSLLVNIPEPGRDAITVTGKVCANRKWLMLERVGVDDVDIIATWLNKIK